MKHRIISGEKNIKISSTAFKKGRKSIKKSNICGGNIKISNTELLVVGKISKISSALFISGGI